MRNRNRFSGWGWAMLLSLCAVAPARGQVEMTGPQRSDPGFFFVDAIAFGGGMNAGGRLDVFVQVGYEGLSFVKQDQLYFASFEITLTLTDSAGGLVNEKTWTEEIKGISFDQSISSTAYNLTQRSFPLPSGTYELNVSIRDRESSVVRRVQSRVTLTDFFGKPFAISDILLINRVTEQGGRRSIVPNISSNIAESPDSIRMYVEIYNRLPFDSLTLVSTLTGKKDEVVFEAESSVAVRKGKDEKILNLSYGDLPIGEYRLFVRAYPKGASTKSDSALLGTTNRTIHLQWKGMPRSVKDLDRAILQLRYIAREGEYDTLSDATESAEKQRLFFQFWNSRDANPNTKRNERMEEYYQRVEYANRHFGHYTEGWRTDMGMIYMMFGPPSNVDRHPFDIDQKPYEVWSYYDISYSFAFLDETGFGDYRLITPLWEVYNRFRR